MTATAFLPFAPPLDAAHLLRFLAARAVPGVEEVDVERGMYRRSVRLAGGPGVIEATLPRAHRDVSRFDVGERREIETRPAVAGAHRDVSRFDVGERREIETRPAVAGALRLSSRRDADEAVMVLRRVLDLDADPDAIDRALSRSCLLAGSVQANPGRRVPGAADPFEIAVRAVLGQQVSVAGARTFAARLVTRFGEPLPDPVGSVQRLFPTPGTLAGADLDGIGLTGARARTLHALARAWPVEDLESLPGIGPWTASYVAMRTGDRDAFLPTDLHVRRAVTEEQADAWRPYRAYAVMHLWG